MVVVVGVGGGGGGGGGVEAGSNTEHKSEGVYLVKYLGSLRDQLY